MTSNTQPHSNKKRKLGNESFINLSMFAVLMVFFVIACFVVPTFFSAQGILNIFAQQSYILIMGIGITFLLISGNFDLSVGGIAACSGVLFAFFCQTSVPSDVPLSTGLGMNIFPAIMLSLFVCLLIGALNAVFVVKMKIASVIVTLGTMSIARGIANVVAHGAMLNVGLPNNFKVLGEYTVGPLGLPVILMIAGIVIALIIEKKTLFGRRMYYIGANSEAAKISGVKVEKEVAILYIVSALLSAFTGIILASKFNAGRSTAAMGYEFDALVATVLGGTSIVGGFGSVLGLLIGTLILGILSTCLNQLGLPPSVQVVAKGAIILIAVVAQRFALNKRNLK